MTDSEKQTEITVRIMRLSKIREELTVAKALLRDGLQRIERIALALGVGQPKRKLVWTYDPDCNDIPIWPSKQNLDEIYLQIERLKSEAETLTAELGNFGIDPDLFKLNGD